MQQINEHVAYLVFEISFPNLLIYIFYKFSLNLYWHGKSGRVPKLLVYDFEDFKSSHVLKWYLNFKKIEFLL